MNDKPVISWTPLVQPAPRPHVRETVPIAVQVTKADNPTKRQGDVLTVHSSVTGGRAAKRAPR